MSLFLNAKCIALKIKFYKKYAVNTVISYRKIRSQPVELSYTYYKPKQPTTSNPILILHGLLGCSKNWRYIAKVLAEHGRDVYALDARNHGESPHTEEIDYLLMAQDVAYFMQQKQIAASAIIGHSMGGRTAMVLAQIQPKLVEKLIVVDVSPKAMPEVSSVILSYMVTMKNSLSHLVENMTLSQARKTIESYLTKFIPEEGIRQFLLTNLYEKDGKIKWRPNLEILRTNFVSTISSFPSISSTYEGDVLFVCGGQSPYVSVSDHNFIRSLFPKAQFVYIPEAGHWVHSEKPKEFIDVVKKFL